MVISMLEARCWDRLFCRSCRMTSSSTRSSSSSGNVADPPVMLVLRHRLHPLLRSRARNVPNSCRLWQEQAGRVPLHEGSRGGAGRAAAVCAREQLPLLCYLPTHARRRGRAIMYSQRARTAVGLGERLY